MCLWQSSGHLPHPYLGRKGTLDLKKKNHRPHPNSPLFPHVSTVCTTMSQGGVTLKDRRQMCLNITRTGRDLGSDIPHLAEWWNHLPWKSTWAGSIRNTLQSSQEGCSAPWGIHILPTRHSTADGPELTKTYNGDLNSEIRSNKPPANSATSLDPRHRVCVVSLKIYFLEFFE